MTDKSRPGGEPVRLQWELHTSASPQRTWAAFSDTDRFNRIAGFNFAFQEGADDAHSTLGRGSSRRLGAIEVTWDELPFRFTSLGQLSSLRRFDGSPAEQMEFKITLTPTTSGTSVRYDLAVWPRSAWQRAVVAVDLRVFVQPRLEQTLKGLIDHLEGRPSPFDDGPPPLGREAADHLHRLSAQLRPDGFGERLERHVLKAPLAEQQAIHPLRLGKSWGMADGDALDAFLGAVGAGVLTLRWELMCPSCRAPKESTPRLSALSQKVHCPSCGIFFDGTFPDSVAITMRPAPSFRTFEPRIECLGSPARTPHFVAQDLLEPGETREIAAPLSVGGYRLRGWPIMDATSVEVLEGTPHTDVELTVSDGGLNPPRVVLGPGVVRLKVTNQRPHPVTLLLEQRWREVDVLTAGRLLTHPGASRLLPREALDTDLSAESLRCAVLAIEATRGGASAARMLQAQLAARSPRLLRYSDRCLLATFLTAEEALTTARELLEGHRLYAAISLGPVLELDLDGARIPMGPTVDEVFQLLRYVPADALALPERCQSDPEVGAVLSRWEVALRAPQHQPDGAPDTRWLVFDREEAQ